MNIYISLIIFASLLFSQNTRYIDEVFSDYVKTEDIVYGNAPDLPFIFLFEWNTFDQDLEMDIYEPEGDTLTNRPAIVILHTGAFFSGHNELDDVVDISRTAAKRGYVVFNIYYRLGLNIFSTYSGERAVFRGVQDLSAAIRYIREKHELYGVDPENIFAWGTSAGSFVALHLAYSQDDERPQSTYGSGSDPDLGCIDCEGNSFDHNSKPNAIVSCWGAIGNLDWIDPDDNVPAIMFHGDLDPVVPFDVGYPFTIDIALPLVYGSSSIHDRLNDLNIENYLFVGQNEIHEYWGTVNGNWFDGPNENYTQITNDAFLFLHDQIDSQVIGDFNSDGVLNILDIVGTIDLILNNGYSDIADINDDGILNVIDIILMINILIGDLP